MNIKTIFLALSVTLLSACGGGGGGSSSPTPTPSVPLFLVDGTSSTFIVNEDNLFDLIISGVSNTITIEAAGKINILTISGTFNDITINGDNDISEISIPGTSNTVTFLPSSTVASFTISGIGNDIFIPIGSGISFTGSGSSNTLTEQ